MKSLGSLNRLPEIATESANARLQWDSGNCPPPEQINSLLIGYSKCACGSCHFNRTIRRGMLSALTRKKERKQKLLSPTNSLGALVEVAGVLNVGIRILSVSLMVATPLLAVVHLSTSRTNSSVTIAFHQSARVPVKPAFISVVREVRERPATKEKTNHNEKSIIPEIVNPPPPRPEPPTNLRLVNP